MTILKMDTNYNSKLSCDIFIHVSLAPAAPVPESKLGQQYKIEVIDHSHPGGSVELLFFYRFPLGAAVDIYTMPSHGMDACDFIQWFLSKNPTANHGTEMAVYFYRKVNID